MEKPRFFSKKLQLPKGSKKVEFLESSLKELFFIENPFISDDNSKETKRLLNNYIKKNQNNNIWIYFPWSNTAIHTVKEKSYFRLRTARNRNIISEEEQANYRKIIVGIAGMSVGSCVLNALVQSGGPQILKLADFDILEITNLNRLKAHLSDVGMEKIDIAAREIWELDPFAKVKIFNEGINGKNVERFISGNPGLNVFIDEMDSISDKIRARQVCRLNRIPVIMATDNGDGIILDIERHDKERNYPFFHGKVKNINTLDVDSLSRSEWMSIATKIIGKKYMTKRHRESIIEVGGSLAGIPQLGTDANFAGSVVSLAVRKIANGEKLNSGKYIFDMHESFMNSKL